MGTNVSQQRDLPFRGVDSDPADRPGVPRESPPHPLPGAHWVIPEQQPMATPVLARVGLGHPTPVFSSALPPRGLSGLLRRIAYRLPDHLVRHWLVLMFADRVDVIESILPTPRRKA